MRLTFALATVALISSIDAESLSVCGDAVNVEAYALYDRTEKHLTGLENFLSFASANNFDGKTSSDDGTTDASDTTADTSTDGGDGTTAESDKTTEAPGSTSPAQSTDAPGSTSPAQSTDAPGSTSPATTTPKQTTTTTTTTTTSSAATTTTTTTSSSAKLRRLAEATDDPTTTDPETTTTHPETTTTDPSDLPTSRSRAIGVVSFASNDEGDDCLQVGVPMPAAAADVDIKSLPNEQSIGEDGKTDSLNAVGHLLSSGMNVSFDAAPTARLIYLITNNPPQVYDPAAEDATYQKEITTWSEAPLEEQTACDAGFPSFETIDALLEKQNTTLVVVSSLPEWGSLVNNMKNARLIELKDGDKRALADTDESLFDEETNNECQRALDRANDSGSDGKKKFKWWHALLIVLGVALLIMIGALIYECTGRSRRHAQDLEERPNVGATSTGNSAALPSTATTAGVGAGTTGAVGSAGSLAARTSGNLQSQQEAARRSGEETRAAVEEARRSGSANLRKGAAGATSGAVAESQAGLSNAARAPSTGNLAAQTGAKGTAESTTAAPNVGTQQAGNAPDTIAPGGIAALKERFNAE